MRQVWPRAPFPVPPLAPNFIPASRRCSWLESLLVAEHGEVHRKGCTWGYGDDVEGMRDFCSVFYGLIWIEGGIDKML